MKIIKYIFLLFLLTSFTISVFVITKDGSYIINKSKLINVPKDKVYHYLLDYKNWEEFNSFKQEDSTIKTRFISKSNWTNSYFTWKGKHSFGKIKSVFTNENDSIAQLLNYKGKEVPLYWTFKDSLEKTKVTWTIKGKMDFQEKFYAMLFRKKFDSKIGKVFNNTLEQLNSVLTTRINTFKISIEGFVQHDTIFYLQHLASCKETDLPLKIKSLVPKLNRLMSATKTELNGSPFVVYHSKDTLKNNIIFSMAIPTIQKVYTTKDSDIVTGQIMPFQAIKARLEGDYSHKPKMLEQVKAYMNKNKLVQNYDFKVIEILKNSIANTDTPNKWITIMYMPVKSKKSEEKEATDKDSIPKTKGKIIKKDSVTNVKKKVS